MRTTNAIAGLFGKSPFKPLRQHMDAVEQCVAQTIPLFNALLEDDREALLAAKERIFEFEEAADVFKNGIRSHLPKSIFMPVDRRDLLDLLHSQDSIADTTQDIAGLLVTRKMVIPETMRDSLFEFLDSNVEATRKCSQIINETDELLETGFRGRRAESVMKMVDELNELETVGDNLGMHLVTVLFEQEDSMKPVDVMFWYELLQLIGDIGDYAEDVGDRLRLLIAR